MVTLSTLGVGARAKVAQLLPDHPAAERLCELGLVEGTPIEVIRVAPFGDPMQVRLRGYKLSLRRADARCVRVDPVDPAAPTSTAR